MYKVLYIVELTFAIFIIERNKANPSVYVKLPVYQPKTCGELTFSVETENIHTKLAEHPWVVGIVFSYPGFAMIFSDFYLFIYINRQFMFSGKSILSVECSGVLISERHALTQGLCVIATKESIP